MPANQLGLCDLELWCSK